MYECVRTFVVFFLFFSQSGGYKLKKVSEDYEVTDRNLQLSEFFGNENNQVVSYVYKTANRFQCRVPYIKNPELILYGTKSWVFPKQNVNLTLSYPSETLQNQDDDESIRKTYVITGFNVLLFLDSMETQGFIVSGGLLEESITLIFECSNVEMLQYEFWLFGVPRLGKKLKNSIFQNYDPIEMC